MSVTNAIRIALESQIVQDVNWFLRDGVWRLGGEWSDNYTWDDDTPIPDPALPTAIAWPNVPFTRITGTPYIRVEYLPVARRPVVAGPDPEQRSNGLFYLTVFTPEEQGAAAGMAIADVLQMRFNGSTAIVTPDVVVRLEYSEAKQPLHDPPFFAIPVEIGWYAYKR